MEELHIRFDTFPKHIVEIRENNQLKNSVDVECGLSVLEQATELNNVFDNMKLQRTLKTACRLFKPIKIKVYKK
jgi:hypothetical protein